ncbi:hypothetical protein Ciccas_006644, partial [Cichlidogyrus casuarinus]
MDYIISKNKCDRHKNRLETAFVKMTKKLRRLTSVFPNCNPDENNRIHGDGQLFYRETINLLKDFQAGSNSKSDTTGIRARCNSNCSSTLNGDVRKHSKSMNNGLLKSASDSTCGNKGLTEFVISRGIHVFNFEFNLPHDLPSTFELPSSSLAGGAYARLSYGLKVVISNFDANVTHTRQVEIIVVRPFDLMSIPL